MRCDLLYESTMDIVEATSEKGFEGAGVLNGWQDEDSRRIGPRPSERLASFYEVETVHLRRALRASGERASPQYTQYRNPQIEAQGAIMSSSY